MRPTIGWLVFAIGAVFYSYEFLLRILPSVMTTQLMATHHITTAGLGYLASIYYIIYTAMQTPVGLLIDWYGPRRLLLFASAICTIGSFCFASTTSLFCAALGRFLIGFGSAFGFVGVLRLASLWLPSHRFALATGLVTTLGMIGGILGDVVLSHLVNTAGWHVAVMLSAWLGIATMGLICFIPKSNPHTFSTRLPHRQWRHLYRELLIILKMPIIWLNAVVGSLLYLPLAIFGELWGVSYLQTVQQISPFDATLAISFLMWGWAIGAPLVGWFADKTGSRYRVVLGLSSASLFFTLYILNTHFSSNITLFTGLFLLGVLCSNQVLIMVIARDNCPAHMLATGLAVTNMIIMGGGIVFQPLIGLMMRSSSAMLLADSNSPDVSIAYTQAMYIVPAAIGLAIVVLGVQLLSRKNALSAVNAREKIGLL
ncbi:MAG: MFS transporter [Legionellales bacterium]|nr:MFS transporter [Legionellales bacterium]